MTAPVVSVHMITYNHEVYIAEAIEGVLKQKVNFGIELVIGEDCSNDGTLQVVLEYQERYPDIIKVITSKKNVGSTKNFIRTIRNCKGKYIAFCEGDDYWHNPEKLQRQVEYMEGHSQCGMIFADCNLYYDSKNKYKRSVRYSDGYTSLMKLSIDDILGEDKINNWPWTLTAIVRSDLCKQVIEKDPYLHQSGKFLMGDTQLFAELGLISDIMYIPECVATYRILEQSASNNTDLRKFLLFWISISEMKLYLCTKYRLSENIRKKAGLLWCQRSLRLAFHDRNPELAKKVKEKKHNFTFLEWFLYFGARNIAIYYGYKLAVLVRDMIKKRRDPISYI